MIQTAGPAKPPAPDVSPGTASGVFLSNLTMILALGVAVSAWLLYYTDWFAHAGVLLALGGAFTWLGAVSKLLSEARLKELQSRLDKAVFAGAGTRVYVVMAALAFLAVASCVGTLDVRSSGEAAERLVWLDASPSDVGAAARLTPSGRVREPRFTTFWSPTQARVKVGGYPGVAVAVRPWRRTSIDVPASLLLASPVVLLRPTKEMAGHVTGLTLVVTAAGVRRERPFDGHAVWIGCEADVHVPPRLLDEWRAVADSAALLSKWQFPRAVDLPLTADVLVDVRFVNSEDGTAYVTLPPIRARRPGRVEEFPQVEDVDVPH